MMIILKFLISLSVFVEISGKSSGYRTVEHADSDVQDQFLEIQSILDKLEHVEGKYEEKARAWCKLGMILQLKDIRHHDFGLRTSMRSETFLAFNKSLELIALSETDMIPLKITVLHRLGVLMKVMGRGKESLTYLHEVLKLAKHPLDKTVALVQISETEDMMGNLIGSIESLRKALKFRSHYLPIYERLVKALIELNTLTKMEWKKLYKEILKKLDRFVSGKFHKVLKEDKNASLYSDISSDASIYWALFRVADILNKKDLAWSYLDKAHEIELSRAPPYDKEKRKKATEQILQVFQPNFWPDPPIGSNSTVPIFIIGMMRSGSTLTETMLDAHKDIWGMGEDGIFGHVVHLLREDLVEVMDSKTPERIKEIVNSHANYILDKMYETMQNATSEISISQPHVPPQQQPVKHIVDLLFNFRNMGLLHLVFPNALVIHIVRDPLDTLYSCFRHKFSDDGLQWSMDPKLAVYEYIQYLEVMHHFRKVLPGRVHEIRYEELVKDPERVIRVIIDKLELKWDPKVMEFYKSNRTVQTLSMSQVRHNVYSMSVGAWRRYATHMKPFIKALNKYLPKLKARGALPYLNEMNWDFDPAFSYGVDGSSGKPSVTRAGSQSCDAGEMSGGSSMDPDAENEPSQYKSKQRGNKNVKKKKEKGRKLKAFNKKRDMSGKSVGKNSNKNSDSKEKVAERNNLSEPPAQTLSPPPKKTIKGTSGPSVKRGNPQDISKKVRELLDSLRGVVDGEMSKQLIGQLRITTGDPVVDEITAIGFIVVNQNEFQQASKIMKSLLELRPDAVAAYIVYGTALALTGQLEEALVVFNQMLEIDDTAFEGYERRAEVYQALGKNKAAIEDLNEIINNRLGDQNTIISAYVKRGKLLFTEKYIRKSYTDFQTALSLLKSKIEKQTLASILFQIGRCERELGLTEKAIRSLKEAIQNDPSIKDYYLELAICYMELSRWQESLPYVANAIKIEPRYKLAYGYRGLLYHNLGRPKDALPDLQKAIDFDPNEPSGMLLKAACLYSLGRFAEASATYDRMLELSPTHDCFFMREIAFFYYVKLDEDVWSWNIDNDMDKKVKEGWSRHLQYTEMFPVGHITDLSVKARNMMIMSGGDIAIKMDAKIKEILELTEPISKWIQLKHPGFMPNERQHRQYAMSVVQMAQLLREHVNLRKQGKEGLLIPNSASSSLKWYGFTPSSVKDGYHVFGWRDMFDVAVRWRQVSEPLDTVWWNDRLEIKAAYNELGLKTHLHHGWTKTVRYGSYIDMGLNLTKTLLLKRNVFSYDQEEDILNAKTIEELFQASGNKSFYVTTSCESLAQPGEHWEGTQITLQVSTSPEGYDYLINSLVYPARDDQYATDMDFTFRAFIRSLGEVLEGKGETATDEAFSHALEMFYYWVIYAPLARGTSATGYAGLMACVIAMGQQIISLVPKGKQLDWEGIFRLTPGEFVQRIKQWLPKRGPTNIPRKWLDSEAGYSLTRDVFRTVRNMMAVIGKLD